MTTPEAPFLCLRFDDPRKPMPAVRPASRRRDWMDAMPAQMGYRCLPIVMANQHGWEICSPVALSVCWSGGGAASDLNVELENADGLEPAAFSHFGNGILSFGLPAILCTPPGYNLWLTGPVNDFKDGAQALSGLIEADWMPFTFSINWKITRANHEIRFEKDDPIAMVFPVRRGDIEAMQPRMRSIHSAPKIRDQALHAMTRRRETSRETEINQRWYMRGEMPDGAAGPPDHQTGLRLKPFAD